MPFLGHSCKESNCAPPQRAEGPSSSSQARLEDTGTSLRAGNSQIKQQQETIWQREADLTAPQEYLRASHPPEPHCQHSQPPPPLPASIPPSIGGEKQRGCRGAEGWRRDGGNISCRASTAPGCEANFNLEKFPSFLLLWTKIWSGKL